MTLDELNGLDPGRAQEELLRCCACERWARELARARPFASKEAVLRDAERAWRALGPADWLKAFGAHPRIGDKEAERRFFSSRSVSEGRGEADEGPEEALRRKLTGQEQAGVASASEEVLEGLAAGNQEYEKKFGFIFLVCATGKSAGEMLALLRGRLGNDSATELRVAAAEHEKITRLRLEKLLES